MHRLNGKRNYSGLQQQQDRRAKSTQTAEKPMSSSHLCSFFRSVKILLHQPPSIWYSETGTQYLYVSTHHKAVHLAILARPAEPSRLVQYSNTFPRTQIRFSLFNSLGTQGFILNLCLIKNTICKTIGVFNITRVRWKSDSFFKHTVPLFLQRIKSSKQKQILF